MCARPAPNVFSPRDVFVCIPSVKRLARKPRYLHLKIICAQTNRFAGAAGRRHRKNHLARAYPFFTLTISGQVEFITQMWISVLPPHTKFPWLTPGSSRECSRASPDLLSLAANGAVISHFYVCTSFVLSLRPILFRPCTFESMSYKKTNFASTFPFFSFPAVCYGANVNVYMSHTRRARGGAEKSRNFLLISERAQPEKLNTQKMITIK